MRFLQLLCIVLLAMILSAALLSCSKNNDAVPAPAEKGSTVPGPSANNQSPTITGTWTGKLFREEKSIPEYIGLRIKDNGTLEVIDIANKQVGAGEWILKGTSFEASCTILPQVKSYFFKGEVNASLDKLGGIWGYDDKGSANGIWDVSK